MILDTKVNPNSLTPGFFVIQNGIINKDFMLVGYSQLFPVNHWQNSYTIIYDNDTYLYKIIWQTGRRDLIPCMESLDYYNSKIISYEFLEDTASYIYTSYGDKFLKIPNDIIAMQECGLYTKFHILSYHYFNDALISDISKIIHVMLVESIRLDYDNYKILKFW